MHNRTAGSRCSGGKLTRVQAMNDAPEDSNQTPGATSPPRAGASHGPSEPFELTPASSVVVDSALPFVRPPTQGFAARPVARSFAPANGIVLPRRPAPAKLGHPGCLSPLADFLASEPLSVSASSATGFAHAGPASSQALLQSVAGGASITGANGVTSDGPWGARSAPLPSANGASEALSPRQPTVDPQQVAASPWLQTGSIPPAALQSQMASLPLTISQPNIEPPQSTAVSGGSRGLVTGLMVLVALCLVGAIVFIAVRSQKKGDDPADVKGGQVQHEFVLDSAPSAPTSAASASAARPVPLQRAPTVVSTSAVKSAPVAPPKDIYDGL